MEEKDDMDKRYRIEGLDCANCAAVLERELCKIPGVHSLSIDFMSQLIRADLDDSREESVWEMIQKVTAIMHPECTVTELKEPPSEKPASKRAYQFYQPRQKAEVHVGFFQRGWIEPILASVLMTVAIVLTSFVSVSHMWEALMFLVPLLVVGFKVYRTAARNLIHGRLFDEKFLMAVASIGAFVLGEYIEACAVLILYQAGELFQDYAVKRSRGSVTQMLALRPEYANVCVDGEWIRVMPESVAIGDLILVKPGERVPLDGVIEDGLTDADTSALTGEAMPRALSVGDIALSGTINLTGAIRVRVTADYRDGTVNRMLDLVQNATAKKARAEQFITRFARVYTPTVVGLALLLAVIPSLIWGDWQNWIYRALSFLVISCPCALVISVPLTYFGAIGGASGRGILIKGSVFIDRLNHVGAAVFDKTGTLTKGELEVERVDAEDPDDCLRTAAHAELFSNHPVAGAVLRAYGEGCTDASEVSGLEELAGCGIECSVGGHMVLCGNAKLMDRYDIDIPDREDGLWIYVARDLEYLGRICFRDRIRSDSAQCVSRLRQEGIRTVMLSGDIKENAEKLGERLGLDESFGELLPEQKLECLARIRDGLPNGKTVAYIGDGINDAPALTGADVGIVLGGAASPAAVGCADVVVMDDRLSAVPHAISLGRKARRIVMENIVFALTVKVGVLALAAVGFAPMWAAVFADVGVAVLAILNAMRMLIVPKADKVKKGKPCRE